MPGDARLAVPTRLPKRPHPNRDLLAGGTDLDLRIQDSRGPDERSTTTPPGLSKSITGHGQEDLPKGGEPYDERTVVFLRVVD